MDVDPDLMREAEAFETGYVGHLLKPLEHRGAWSQAGNVSYLFGKYNNCVNVESIADYLVMRGIAAAVRPHKENRQKVRILEVIGEAPGIEIFLRAEIYFSSNAKCSKSTGGCWIIVGKFGWQQRMELNNQLQDHVQKLAEINYNANPVNEVTKAEEAAAAVGIETMRLPAPLPEAPRRTANDSWITLYQDYVDRFHPEESDMEVLVNKLGFPAKSTMESHAPRKSGNPRTRWEHVLEKSPALEDRL